MCFFLFFGKECKPEMGPNLFMMTGSKQELQGGVGWYHLQTRMCRLLGDDHLEGASSLGNTLHIMEIVVNITHL